MWISTVLELTTKGAHPHTAFGSWGKMTLPKARQGDEIFPIYCRADNRFLKEGDS